MAKKKNELNKSVNERLVPTSLNLDKSVKSYRSLLKEENKDKDINKLKEVLNNGETYIRQTQRTETKKFDLSIIDELEEGVQAIEKIVSNPKSFIKEFPELVPVGLAKKVSSLSIRHFATHSQFIRNVNENNEVIPEKVLTIYSETDTAIYENRFVMTLIRRTLDFIQTRYNFIIEHGETKDSDLLLVHNKTVIDDITYEVDSRIKISVPSLDDGNLEKNNDLLRRLNELKNRVQGYFASPFMTEMKGAKEVSSPIHMTNVIVKHPDYHRCYLFWEFLEAYDELGVSYDVKEINQRFSDEYLDEIKTHIANSIATLHTNKIDDRERKIDRKETYTPEVIFTLEDETYEQGRFIYDAYPEAKEKKKNPLPSTSLEVRNRDERLHQRLKNQKDAKVVVDRNIRKHKDDIILEEAEKRKALRDSVTEDINLLFKEIRHLRSENDRLLKEVDDLKENEKKLKEKATEPKPVKKPVNNKKKS